jgi:hypothetical protein
VTPAPTPPSTPTTTSPALPPAPPAEPVETTPVIPPDHAPTGETPLVPTPGTPHHLGNGGPGNSRYDEQPRSQGNGCYRGPSAPEYSDRSSRDRQPESRHSRPRSVS